MREAPRNSPGRAGGRANCAKMMTFLARRRKPACRGPGRRRPGSNRCGQASACPTRFGDPTMKIYTLDTTLRDGTQGESVSFSVEDKIDHRPETRRARHRLHRGRLAGLQSQGQGILRPRRRAEVEARAVDRVRLYAVRAATGRDEDRNVQALMAAGTPVVSIFGKSWDLHTERALGISRRGEPEADRAKRCRI